MSFEAFLKPEGEQYCCCEACGAVRPVVLVFPIGDSYFNHARVCRECGEAESDLRTCWGCTCGPRGGKLCVHCRRIVRLAWAEWGVAQALRLRAVRAVSPALPAPQPRPPRPLLDYAAPPKIEAMPDLERLAELCRRPEPEALDLLRGWMPELLRVARVAREDLDDYEGWRAAAKRWRDVAVDAELERDALRKKLAAVTTAAGKYLVAGNRETLNALACTINAGE